MRSASLCILSLILLVAASFPLLAQETTGRLEGRVLDPAGQPVAYANVMVTGPSLQGTRGTLTSSQGRFVMLVLPVGEYTVSVSHVSYQERRFEPVRIRLGQTSTLGDVKLEERIYTTQEIVVEAEAPLIDPVSTYLGGNLAAKDYEALPIERNYQNVATLLPQANQSYLGDPVNFAGSTGFENRYFVDGIDVTDSYRSWGGASLPYNFIEEVQIKIGGYEAEYRSSLGGVVNALTYSGSNRLKGQVFGFFTNNMFMGTPRSMPDAKERGDFSIYDIGFGLGGPILTDRLWYYAAYNPTFRQEDVEIIGWGPFEDWTKTHSFAGKLTWKANERNTVTFTAIGDPSRSRSVVTASQPPEALDPFLIRINSGGLNFMLDGRHLIRENVLIESSLSRSSREDDYYSESERGRTVPLFTYLNGVQAGGGNTVEYVQSTVIMPRVKLTWSKGDHEIKTGMEYKDAVLDFDITMWGIWQNSDTSYDGAYWMFNGKVGNRIPSAFVQDSWRLTDNMRLNAGVRWDGQFIMSSEGKVAQKILDQWQPRIGFIFQPGRSGEQKFFGSFGRFYQELATSGAFWYFNAGNRSYDVHWDHNPLIDPAGGDTTVTGTGKIQPANPELEGQYFDEFTLGYERQIGWNAKLGARGVYRTLRQGVEDCCRDDGCILGNPGSGLLTAFPHMRRDYSALELSYQQTMGEHLFFLASYVLSKTYGNYEGLFDSEYGNMWVNATGLFDVPERADNNGLLPNDRTHVFKLSGSYRLAGGLTFGAFGFLESGTPLNEWGRNPNPIRPDWEMILLQPRGEAGRTPSIWDLSLRVTYQPAFAATGRWRPKLTVDFLHIASQRRPLIYDQMHYFGIDAEGNQTNPNPHYGQPTSWQPPMSVRLGAEVQF